MVFSASLDAGAPAAGQLNELVLWGCPGLPHLIPIPNTNCVRIWTAAGGGKAAWLLTKPSVSSGCWRTPPHSNYSIFNLEFELIVVKEVFEGKVSIEFHSELCAFHAHFLREAGFDQYHIPLKTAFFVVGPHNIDTFMFFGSVNSLPLKATRIFQNPFVCG